MATAEHDSSPELQVEGVLQDRPPLADSTPPLEQPVWLDGDVLACACPDCGTPMSVRLWLSVADCWRCGASIELSDEQEREALRLLRERESSRRADAERAGGAVTPTMLPLPKAPPPPAAAPSRQSPPIPPPPPKDARAKPAARQRGLGPARAGLARRSGQLKIREIYQRATLGVALAAFLKDLPAWLVSLVVHLAAILLLGLWIAAPAKLDESITLATAIGHEDVEGDTEEVETVNEEAFEFDDPGAIPIEAMLPDNSPGRSDLSLESVALLPIDPIGLLPDLSEMALALPAASGGSMYAGRDPKVRAELVRREGGTTETEAAVARGLKWLARHQNANGSWSLDAWHRAPRATGPADGLGGMSDTAGTALALLPFLGAGQTHLHGEYSDTVFRGLRWLIDEQKDDGDLRGKGIGRMYAHGQAAIVLSEAYALTADEQLRGPAQKALDFIVAAQHPAGGWRYQPGEAGDTSVVGWQLMALRSGKMAYLRVPDQVFVLAERYLDEAATDRYQSRYAYRPGGGASHVMTAEALLCRQYLGWSRDHHGLAGGVQWLAEKYPPDPRSPNVYYWYYATQVMHHMGGRVWDRWNARMRSVLVAMQEKHGPLAGSWSPRGDHAGSGGRIYMTALAVCILEVYYRHLPMYRDDAVKHYSRGLD